MKFKIFKLHELIYKKIAYALVFIITVGCIVLYFYKRDSEEIAFIISLFYALFLFIISVYINDMSTKIQNMFHRRKEQYRSLKELAEIYKPTSWDKDDLLSYVIFAQGMTGRIDDGKRPPLIRINGFEYTEKYLKLENSFLALRRDLHALLNDEINKYITTHKLIKKVRNLFVHDMTKFFADVNGWVDEHLELTAEEKTDFFNFIEHLRKVNKKQFKEWDRAIKKIKKMIRKTSEKCHANILRIEEVYGEMLLETLSEENELYTNFNVLENLIKEMKDEALIFSNFEEITGEHFDRLHDYLEVIERKLELIKEEVEEISINTNHY
jgi:hypothetical protein